MNLWSRLEEVARQHDVLRHPFYLRWTAGELTPAELALYAGQYRHAVLALADASTAAASSPEAGEDAAMLAEHAREEAEHVALWDEFLLAAGGDAAAAPTAETRACTAAWRGEASRPLAETLATMLAIESAQPAIAATKQEGLERFYEIDATAYFEIHRERDVEHAAQMRDLLARRLPSLDEDALVKSAAGALSGNWRLLDGVELACTRL